MKIVSKVALCMSFATFALLASFADTKVVDGITWTYTVSGGEASLGAPAIPKSTTGAIIIPSLLGGKPVTSIGPYAFYGCSGLTSVTIPNSVTSIGYYAFFECRGLTSVTIPDSVMSIGQSAFNGCSGLASVMIPNSVTSICPYTFARCEALASVTIPDSVTNIDWAVFAGSGVRFVKFGNGLRYLDEESFDSDGFRSAHPEIMVFAGDAPSASYGSLDGCGGCRIFVPRGSTGWGVDIPGTWKGMHIEYIDEPVFTVQNGVLTSVDLRGTTDVTIPDYVTSIGPGAFSNRIELLSVVIPNSVTNIGENAFWGCISLSEITVPNSVQSIGYAAFSGCSGLKSMTLPFVGARRGSGWSSLNDGYEVLFGYVFGSSPYSGGTVVHSSYPPFDGVVPSSLREVVITDDTGIGESAFMGCTMLTSVKIQDGVTSIGGSAFYGCSGLTSVSIPDGVTRIGWSAFQGCSSLTSVTIPNSVTDLGNWMFTYCSELKSVTIGTGVTYIGEATFYQCGSLTSIYISDLAAWCGIDFDDADIDTPHKLFLNGMEITDLTIPDTVTGIKSDAFRNCTGIKSVTIPASVTNIAWNAFYGCTNVCEATVPGWKCGIPFDNVTNLTISAGTTSIGDSAFWGCPSLTSVSIPGSVEYIDEDAFGSCCNLSLLTIEKGFRYDLDEGFDYGSTNLTSIQIADLAVWCENASYIPINWRHLIVDGKEVTDLVIPDSVTNVGNYAFKRCSGLTSVTVPGSVTSIGTGAFSFCANLTSVTIDNGVEVIGSYAFNSCGGLTSVTIPDSVTSIGYNAFGGCNSLASATIPNSVTNIGEYAFYGTALTTVYVSFGDAERVKQMLSASGYDVAGVTFVMLAVTDVAARQRYPWNGLVDITCRVTGIDETAGDFYLYASAVDLESHTTNAVSHFWLMQNGVKTSSLAVRTNGNYRLLWDARADLGEGICSNMVVRVALKTHDKVQLWEDGPYWATTNIGAEEPEDYGYYFWWGDTVGYKRENNAWVATDGSSSFFGFGHGNAPTIDKNTATLLDEGWIVYAPSQSDNVVVLANSVYRLTPEHDAAQVQWGGGWRMPTSQELYDLCNNKCDWTWTTKNGVNGCVVRGRDAYASNSIFLPAAGYGYVAALGSSGLSGGYWSMCGSGSTSACALGFSSGAHTVSGKSCWSGWSIRPVQGFMVGGTAMPAGEMLASVLNAGDSAPFILDTMDGPRVSDGNETLAYSSLWDGGDGATVTIAQNGAALADGLTGEGECAWSVTWNGTYVLTHTTYTNGVAVKVETAIFIVTDRDDPFPAVDAFDGLPVAVAPDGSGGWTVTVTNDIAAADLPIELPDNIGPVTIDLNGHDLVGPDGQPVIVIVPGDGAGEPTAIAFVNSGDDATVKGGEGEPAVAVAEDAQDGVVINIGEGVAVQGGDEFTPAIDGEVGENEGTVVEPSRFHIPGEGTVTTPKTWRSGQKVTWKAPAAKGSVFAHWEGASVDLLGLSRNQLRNPSLAFAVPDGFDADEVRAVFIPVDDDRLGLLALSQTGPLAPNVEVAGLELLDDSESYVTASMSGLPTGLKFDAKTLAITGKPTKPGVYTVKVTAKNASGYQWAENIELRVSDIEDARIDFGELPDTGAVGKAYAGQIAAGEFKTLSASGLPSGLRMDAKSGAVAGVPTKGGYFTVTVTATYADRTKATATRLLTISPVAAAADPKRTAYHPLTVVSADAAQGTVTGTGVYAEGKKASVSAKPARGYVFAGWYLDPGLTKPMTFASGDFRKASQSVAVPEARYLFARFVGSTTAEDPVTGIAATSKSFRWCVGVSVPDCDGVTYVSASLPTVSASGLPSGVKFDALRGCFTGVPTKAGEYSAMVTVKNASKATDSVRVTVKVEALPAWAQGKFDGALESGTGEVDGLVTLTVAANGKVSGKVMKDGLSWTLAASSFDAVDWTEASPVYHATVIGKNGKNAFTNEVEVAAEDVAAAGQTPCLRGVATSGEWAAWQSLWKQDPWKTAAQAYARAPKLPVGGIELKFAASGAVTAKYGTCSCSTTLIPEGDGTFRVFCYFVPRGEAASGAEIPLEWDAAAKAFSVVEQ